MKTIELTPAELKMIEIEREKKALAEKEAAAKDEIELGNKIQDKKKGILMQIGNENEMKAATEKLFAQLHVLDQRYSLVETAKDETHTVTKYYGRDYNVEGHPGKGPNGEEEVVHWSEVKEHFKYHIQHGSVRISPERKYSSDTWRPTFKGIEFEINKSETRRTYKSAKTINEFVAALEAKVTRERNEAARLQDNQAWLLEEVAKMYPTALTVTAESNWQSVSYRASGGYERKYVKAKFKSGMAVQFNTMQSNGGDRKVQVLSVITGEKNQQAIIDLLK